MRIFIPAFLALGAIAQSPGNGISKSTYSCNDPIAGKKFLYKYFPVATPGDECTNDICVCSAGTGGETEWYIQQGRVYALESSSTKYGPKNLGPGPGPSPGNGFGMHLVNVSNHLTTGGMSTAEVEAQFTQKLGDMSKYDAFMDFNVVFSTTDLSGYAAAFKKDGINFYSGSYTHEGSDWSSLIVHVPNTQLVIELISNSKFNDTLLGSNGRNNTMEPRLTSRAARMILEGQTSSDNGILTPLAVNRAVSKEVLAKLDDFYVTGMGTKKVASESVKKSGYTRYCYLWPGATVDVCFTSREESATKGDFKVADFEKMLNTVHENIIKGYPLCAVDKWEDNHYAIDSMSADTDAILKYVEANDDLYYVCMSGMGPPGSGDSGATLSYLFDPTGWGIQMDLGFQSAPSSCSSSAVTAQTAQAARPVAAAQVAAAAIVGDGGGTYNPACSPGTCKSSLFT